MSILRLNLYDLDKEFQNCLFQEICALDIRQGRFYVMVKHKVWLHKITLNNMLFLCLLEKLSTNPW